MEAHERNVPAGVRPLAPGDPPSVGRYTLLGRLGTGGMGTVYLGRALDEGDLIAVKTLHPAYVADPEARLRFRTEAEYARRVSSCCTARVIEDGSDLSHPFLATEFIQGPPLSLVVTRDGPLSPDALQAVAIGVADALQAIHEAGVAHRDLKPSNVLLARSGPRIIDFGIAHELAAAGGPTKAGIVMGSPGWIAPERLTGAPATAASDVFGWGMLVAYAATGRNPFGTGDAEQLAERIVKLPPDLSGLGEPLHELVKAALAKDPATRPCAEGLLSALLALREEKTAALAITQLWEPPPDPRPHRPRRRLSGAPAAGLAAAAAVLVAVVFMMVVNRGAQAGDPGTVKVTVTSTVPGAPGGGPAQAGEGAPGRPPGADPVYGPSGAPTGDPGLGPDTKAPSPEVKPPPAAPSKPAPRSTAPTAPPDDDHPRTKKGKGKGKSGNPRPGGS